MRAVIQRVSSANVSIDNLVVGKIKKGLLILLGIHTDDTLIDVKYLASKIYQMRIFNDTEEKMNLSVQDINGSLLVISQFTLFAATAKGNRPSFIQAARPETAIPLYEAFLTELESLSGKRPERGIFGADMKVSLTNDGPVTIIIDSKEK
jgi:D-tyrosyl-tRNA(Tyr) deacylase